MIVELEGEGGFDHLDEYRDGKSERGKALRRAICEKFNFASLEFQTLEGIELLASLGFRRAVIPRELSKKEIEYLLTQGTLDQLMDALDFAPAGVIDLIKDMSVKLELADIHKRKAILEKTGFNVTKAIEINIETSGDEVESTQSRRAAPVGKSAEKTNGEGRKTQPIIIKK